MCSLLAPPALQLVHRRPQLLPQHLLHLPEGRGRSSATLQANKGSSAARKGSSAARKGMTRPQAHPTLLSQSTPPTMFKPT